MKSPARPNAKSMIRLISLFRRLNIINPFLLQASIEKNSVSGGIRTPNLLIRSQMLYPVELQTQLMVPGETETGGQRDSNPQQPEPQSGALPLSYDHHRKNRTPSLRFVARFAKIKGWRFLFVSFILTILCTVGLQRPTAGLSLRVVIA